MEKPVERSGGCACRAIRYRVTNSPLIIHACHCRDCQRVTGGAFVINLWIERKFVDADHALPRSCRLSGGSGNPHDVFFCGICGTTLWSRYHIVRSDCLFVRAGTLDQPESVRPDVHIFTRSKVPWLDLPSGTVRFDSTYKIDEVWPPASKDRLRANASAAG
jgi:hypothetical protein